MNRRSIRARIFIGLAAAALLAAPIYFTIKYYSAAAPAGAASRPQDRQPVEIVRPARATLSRTIELPATIEAFERADLYAKVSGYIKELKVDVGDRVKEGDLLASIDIPELAQDLAESKAQLAARSSMLRASEALLQQARQSVETIRSQSARYRTELDLQEMTFKRKEELFQGKGISQQDLDDARNRLDLARADVSIAEAKIKDSTAAVASAEAGRQVAAAQADVASAQIEKINTLIQYARIVAPFNGTITRRLIDRGALVQAATSTRTNPLFTIQRIDIVRAVVEAPEAEASYIKPGTPAKVKIYRSDAPPIEQKVARTAGALGADARTLRVEIDIDNSRGVHMPGMYAQVEFIVTRHENALAIPAAAILKDSAETYIFTIVNDQAVRTAVTLGLEDGGRVEILGGLQEDSKVVVVGKERLRPGMNVEVKSK